MDSRFGQTMSTLALLAATTLTACPKSDLPEGMVFKHAGEIYVDNTKSCVVSTLYDPQNRVADVNCKVYCGSELRPPIDGFSWDSHSDLGVPRTGEYFHARELCTLPALQSAVAAYRRRHHFD